MLEDEKELVGLIKQYGYNTKYTEIREDEGFQFRLVGWKIVLENDTKTKRITLTDGYLVRGLQEALTAAIMCTFEQDLQWPAKDLLDQKKIQIEDL